MGELGGLRVILVLVILYIYHILLAANGAIWEAGQPNLRSPGRFEFCHSASETWVPRQSAPWYGAEQYITMKILHLYYSHRRTYRHTYVHAYSLIYIHYITLYIYIHTHTHIYIYIIKVWHMNLAGSHAHFPEQPWLKVPTWSTAPTLTEWKMDPMDPRNRWPTTGVICVEPNRWQRCSRVGYCLSSSILEVWVSKGWWMGFCSSFGIAGDQASKHHRGQWAS